jgi:hypothetical protein
MGRYSSVGIGPDYGLGGPVIGSRWGRDFSHMSRPALGPTMGTGSFPGVKWPGSGVNHSPPSSAEVKECKAIPLPPSGILSLLGVPLPFTITLLTASFNAILLFIALLQEGRAGEAWESSNN